MYYAEWNYYRFLSFIGNGAHNRTNRKMPECMDLYIWLEESGCKYSVELSASDMQAYLEMHGMVNLPNIELRQRLIATFFSYNHGIIQHQ